MNIQWSSWDDDDGDDNDDNTIVLHKAIEVCKAIVVIIQMH